MKAVCFSSFGSDPKEVLSVQEIPKPFIPENARDRVLIKVHACALNPIDKIRLRGELAMVTPEPFADRNVLGYDVAGIVEETTCDDDRFRIGDHVFARLDTMEFGALAEYVLCNGAEVGKKPPSIGFSEAAAVPLTGLTALQALRKGGVTEGSKVFVPGGAGGVGTMAIQIAKTVLKAGSVCTTASPGIGTELCLRLGADRVLDYRTEDFEQVLAGEDFDMIFDTMNEGHKFGSLLKKGGKVVSISGPPTIEAIERMSGSGNEKPGWIVRLFVFAMRNRKAEAAAARAGGSWEYIFMRPSGSDLDELASYLETGAIEAVVDTEAKGLEDFATAAERLWSGRSKGKCVIKVVQ
eukprot:jgi/Psemu1/205038/e_gw1.364.36.1